MDLRIRPRRSGLQRPVRRQRTGTIEDCAYSITFSLFVEIALESYGSPEGGACCPRRNPESCAPSVSGSQVPDEHGFELLNHRSLLFSSGAGVER